MKIRTKVTLEGECVTEEQAIKEAETAWAELTNWKF